MNFKNCFLPQINRKYIYVINQMLKNSITINNFNGELQINATSLLNRGYYNLNLSAIDECGRALSLFFTVLIN